MLSIGFLIILMITPVLNVPGPIFVKSPDTYIQLLLLTIGMILAIRFRSMPFKHLLLPIFITILILLCHALINESIYQFGDSAAYMFARLPVTIFVAYISSLILIYTKKELALNTFFKAIIFAALAQGLVIWLSFFIPSFRDFMSIIFYREIVEGAEHLVMLRVPGFIHSGGDGLSMNQSLLCVSGLLGVFLCFNTSHYRNIIVIGLVFSMLSTVFTGRTGFYLGTFFFILIFATQSTKFHISRAIFRFVVMMFFLFIPVLLFSQYIGTFAQSLLNEYGYEHPIVRLLKGFIFLQDEGVYGDDSIKSLFVDMVVIPDDPIRFLFGNGNFGQLNYARVPTDVGYFRMWHGIGLYGLFIFIFGLFLYPYMKVRALSFIVKKHITDKSTDRLVFLHLNILSIILFFGFIGHYKIFFLTTRIYVFIFFVLLFLIYNKLRSIQLKRTS